MGMIDKHHLLAMLYPHLMGPRYPPNRKLGGAYSQSRCGGSRTKVWRRIYLIECNIKKWIYKAGEEHSRNVTQRISNAINGQNLNCFITTKSLVWEFGRKMVFSYLSALPDDVTEYTSPFPRNTSTGHTMAFGSTRPVTPPFGRS
jgi:hypothetical protein